MKNLTQSKIFWSAVLIGLLVAIGALNYKKDDRLPCQKEVVCFDRWRDDAVLIDRARTQLAAGNYELTGRQEYARYMKSDLNGTLTIDAIDTLFAEAIGLASKPGESPLLIDYRLIENDKLDPAKKNPPKVDFSGYLLVSFKQDNREVYRFQIDYLDPKAADLRTRITCAVSSFLKGRK